MKNLETTIRHFTKAISTIERARRDLYVSLSEGSQVGYRIADDLQQQVRLDRRRFESLGITKRRTLKNRTTTIVFIDRVDDEIAADNRAENDRIAAARRK